MFVVGTLGIIQFNLKYIINGQTIKNSYFPKVKFFRARKLSVDDRGVNVVIDVILH